MAVLPTDVAVVDPTPTPTLTLTTCNPRYSASQTTGGPRRIGGQRPGPPQSAPVAPPPATHTPDGPDRTATRLAGCNSVGRRRSSLLTTVIWIGARRTPARLARLGDRDRRACGWWWSSSSSSRWRHCCRPATEGRQLPDDQADPTSTSRQPGRGRYPLSRALRRRCDDGDGAGARRPEPHRHRRLPTPRCPHR